MRRPLMPVGGLCETPREGDALQSWKMMESIGRQLDVSWRAVCK
jgi:hypothetical protein